MASTVLISKAELVFLDPNIDEAKFALLSNERLLHRGEDMNLT